MEDKAKEIIEEVITILNDLQWDYINSTVGKDYFRGAHDALGKAKLAITEKYLHNK